MLTSWVVPFGRNAVVVKRIPMNRQWSQAILKAFDPSMEIVGTRAAAPPKGHENDGRPGRLAMLAQHGVISVFWSGRLASGVEVRTVIQCALSQPFEFSVAVCVEV